MKFVHNITIALLLISPRLFADSPALTEHTSTPVKVSSSEICGAGFSAVTLGIRSAKPHVVIKPNGELLKGADGAVIELMLRPREAGRLAGVTGKVKIGEVEVSLEGMIVVQSEASRRSPEAERLRHLQHKNFLLSQFEGPRDNFLREASVENAAALQSVLTPMLEWAYRYERLSPHEASSLQELAVAARNSLDSLATNGHNPDFNMMWALFYELEIHSRSIQDRADSGAAARDRAIPLGTDHFEFLPWHNRHSPNRP